MPQDCNPCATEPAIATFGVVATRPDTGLGYIERGEYSPSLELGLKIAAVFALPVDTVFSLEPFAVLDADAFAGD